MNPNRIKILSGLSIAFFTAILLCGNVLAQGYPNKPVRLIVPYPAGGGTDFFARLVGGKMAEFLGQQIVVENRPGAATLIGAEAAARSPADGYTLLLADSTTVAVNPNLYKKLPYDPQKDFAPISLTARFAMLLVVNPNVMKAGSVKEFVDAAKAPGKLNFASVGAGTTHHLAMELFMQQTGIQMTHIPYKGAAPAVQDLLGGQVPAMFLDLATGRPHILSGKIRALGVASPKRIAPLPDVPTIAESGVPGFEAWAWQGLLAPAGTPADALARIRTEYAKAVNDPAVRQKLLDAGIEPLTSTPDEFTAYMKSETAKWAKVVKDANIKVE
jgi:tripartite-type tricarboxylate transporter receptor subunit TctC